MTDTFLLLPELVPLLGGSKTVKHLREIGMAQQGRFARPRFSAKCLRSYPPIVRGPGNRYGVWLSEFENWREDMRT